MRLTILFVLSLTGKMNFSLSPFAPENLVSRNGFGRPVPRQPIYSFSSLRLNLVLTHGIPPEFRDGVHILVPTYIRHRVSPELTGSYNCVPMAFTGCRMFSICPLHANSGCGKREAQINWSMVMQRQHPLMKLL